MADVFVSYKKLDRARVEKLVAALVDKGFSVWWDYEIESGDNWLERIVEEVANARCLVGFWTNNALTSKKLFIPSEKDRINYLDIEHRKAGKQRIAGAMMDADAIPLHYADIQMSDLTDWDGEADDHPGFVHLIAQVTRLATPPAVFEKMREYELLIDQSEANATAARKEITMLSRALREEQQAAAALRISLARAEERAEAAEAAVPQSDGGLAAELATLREQLAAAARREAALKAQVERLTSSHPKIGPDKQAIPSVRLRWLAEQMPFIVAGLVLVAIVVAVINRNSSVELTKPDNVALDNVALNGPVPDEEMTMINSDVESNAATFVENKM